MELFGQLVAAPDARPETSVLVARTFGGTHALTGGESIELDEVCSITHARHEQAAGRQVADAETMRRAAFLTAVACYELDRTTIGT